MHTYIYTHILGQHLLPRSRNSSLTMFSGRLQVPREQELGLSSLTQLPRVYHNACYKLILDTHLSGKKKKSIGVSLIFIFISSKPPFFFMLTDSYYPGLIFSSLTPNHSCASLWFIASSTLGVSVVVSSSLRDIVRFLRLDSSFILTDIFSSIFS